MRNQAGGIFDISVAEISEILVQQGAGLACGLQVLVLYRRAVIGKGADGNLSFSIFSAAERATVPSLVI